MCAAAKQLAFPSDHQHRAMQLTAQVGIPQWAINMNPMGNGPKDCCVTGVIAEGNFYA